MNVEREQRLQELLTAALDIEAPVRDRWLREQTSGDDHLLRDVQSQLDAADGLGDFLERPAVFERVAGEHDAPPEIPHYEILGRLGGGAMGEVFRARQHHPISRLVALKRVHAHLPAELQRRFFAEQQALARSTHECIARIYDAGTTDDGSPWFAMELVDGEPLTRYCDGRRLSIEERLRLMIEVSSAVEHAHRKQILHRDLKPSNVLVVESESGPRPKVIDFGIAKLLDDGLSEHTFGGSFGTPAYMSPEALGALGGADVDTRADVYSLGVLLFELVVGRRPFDADRPPLGELVRRVREWDPPTTAQVFERFEEAEARRVADERSTDVAALRRLLVGDLRWILARALAPDRELRFGSAHELADDLRRHLLDQPVTARAPGRVYRLHKFWRRHRTEMGAAAVALLGLAAGAVSLTIGLQEARREAESARTALAESEATSEFLIDLFRGADPTATEGDLSVGDLLDRGAEQIEQRLARQPLARGRLLHTLADVYMERGAYDRAEHLLEEAVELLETRLPVGHPDRASALRSIGVLNFHRGDWERAEQAFDRATREIEPSADPEGWALGRHNLGVAVYRQGRLDEAETHLRAAYEVRQRDLPPDHPHLARSTNALGALLISRGKPIDAVALLEQSLLHREQTLGERHPDLAKTLINLGKVEYDLGLFDAAARRFERAVALEQAALGPDHPDLATSLENLSLAYLELDRAEAALEAADRMVAIRRAIPSAPPRLASSLLVRGRVLVVVGAFERAEADLREVVVLQDQVPSTDDVARSRPKIALAHLAVLGGRLDEAERDALEVLRTREQAGGSLGYPKRVLALVAAARGETNEAERWFRTGLSDFVEGRRAASGSASNGGPMRSWERALRRDFGDWLRTQGRIDEAEEVVRAADHPAGTGASR